MPDQPTLTRNNVKYDIHQTSWIKNHYSHTHNTHTHTHTHTESPDVHAHWHFRLEVIRELEVEMKWGGGEERTLLWIFFFFSKFILISLAHIKKNFNASLIHRVCLGYETNVSGYWTRLATSSACSPVYVCPQKGNPLSELPAFVTFSCVSNAWQCTRWGTEIWIGFNLFQWLFVTWFLA